MKSLTFVQIFVLKLFETLPKLIEDLSKFFHYVSTILTQDLGYIVEYTCSGLKVCSDPTCSKFLVAEREDSSLNVVYNDPELALLLAEVTCKYIATEGVKKVVVLYEDVGDHIVRIFSEKTSFVERLVSFMHRLVNMLILLLMIVIVPIVLVLVGGLSSILAVLVVISLLSVTVPELLVRSLHAVNISGKRIFKLEISLAESVSISKVQVIMKLLRGVESLPKTNIANLVYTLHDVLGPDLVDVKLVHLSISGSLSQELARRSILLLIAKSQKVNAFSIYSIRKYVILTSKIVALLTNPELETVIFHEVGHIVRLHSLKTLAAANIVALVLFLISYVCLTVSIPLHIIVLIDLLLSLAMLISVWSYVRKLELEADDYAISRCGCVLFTRTLIKVAWRGIVLELERPLLSSFLKVFSTHPSPVYRILRCLEIE